MRVKHFLATVTLNIWFHFWFPALLVVSVLIGVVEMFFVRLFRPMSVGRELRRRINRYGRSVVCLGWPWIRVEVLNAPPVEEGPYVVVENHSSSFDPFVQGCLPYDLVQAARGWALRLPILGIVGRLAGYLDVDALGGDELVERAVKRLGEGVSVVFFPEGTRHVSGEIGPFHGAAFRAAEAARVPIAPAVVIGISDKPRKGSFLMRPGKITIRFLDLIKSEERAGMTVVAMKKQVRAMMENALADPTVDS